MGVRNQQEDITALANSSYQDKKSESPSPQKRASNYYEEGFQQGEADAGGTLENSDQKAK